MQRRTKRCDNNNNNKNERKKIGNTGRGRRRRKTFNFLIVLYPFRSRAIAGKKERRRNWRQKKNHEQLLLENRHTALEVIAKYNYILTNIHMYELCRESGERTNQRGSSSSQQRKNCRYRNYTTAVCLTLLHGKVTMLSKRPQKIHENFTWNFRLRFCKRKI